MKNVKQEYIEVPLVTVMKAFADGFTADSPKKEIVSRESFIDTVKGIAIFKLTVAESE